MKKISITKKQKEALEILKKEHPNRSMEVFSNSRHLFGLPLQPLLSFTIDELARLLYESESYIIEDPFQEGDILTRFSGSAWGASTYTPRGYVFRVESILKLEDGNSYVDNEGRAHRDVRPATKEEKEFFIKWENVKNGDIILVDGEVPVFFEFLAGGAIYFRERLGGRLEHGEEDRFKFYKN